MTQTNCQSLINSTLPVSEEDKSTSSNNTEQETNHSLIPKNKRCLSPEMIRPKKYPVSLLEKTLFTESLDMPYVTALCPFEFVPHTLNTPSNYQNYIKSSLTNIALLSQTDVYPALQFSPIQAKRRVVLLDLDETLVHWDKEGQFGQPDLQLPSSDPEDAPLNLFIRPFLDEFLKSVSQHFDLYLYTASDQEYADMILEQIDPSKAYFQGRFARKHCIRINDSFTIKDLRIFKHSLKDIVLVDNNLFSFTNQLDNGILVSSFTSNKEDKELLSLKNYLLNYLKSASDVREANSKIFQFQEICDSLRAKSI